MQVRRLRMPYLRFFVGDTTTREKLESYQVRPEKIFVAAERGTR